MVEPIEMKAFKKDLVNFKKLAKKEPLTAKESGENIIKKIDNFLKDEQLKNDVKVFNTFNETRDTINLFLSNIEQLSSIKDKWSKKDK